MHDDDREQAWGRLHEALPARWTVGHVSYDPGRQRWSISAVGPHPGRGRIPESVAGFGEGEVAAVRDLDARLRGEYSEGPRRLDELRRRLRLAYVDGAEAWTQETLGRSLDPDELVRVVERYTGL